MWVNQVSDCKRFDELPPETKALLANLSREDVETIKNGLPIIRAIIGFGMVTKWLAIFAIGVVGGVVMLGESITKIVAWFNK